MSVSLDERLGLTGRERRMIRVRFHEPVDDGLRAELAELVRRRGTASYRAAERTAPIELVVDDLRSEHERIVGSLQPPYRRHGPLREIAQRDALKHAVRVLQDQAFADGCELRPASARGQR